MQIIADILLASGALGAGFYCLVLSRRLKRFNSLESGMGSAVAVLSTQVDELSKTMENIQKSAHTETEKLGELTVRAEETSKKLEIMMASLHDLPSDLPSTHQMQSEPIFTRSSRRSNQ